MQFIHDVISWLKARLKGEKVSFKITRLENRFAAVLRNVDTNAQKNNTTNDGDVQYEIISDSQGDFVRINTNQDLFDGKTVSQMQEIARKLIRDKFKGKVLAVGEHDKAYINKRSSEEYAYPANRRIDNDIKEAKMRASAEFENLLAVSQFIKNAPDDGRHPDATGGWNKYRTLFEVNGQMFEGETEIKVTSRGYVFYDITKIRRITRNGGLTENNSAAASGNPLIDSINNKSSSVNTHYTQEIENYS